MDSPSDNRRGITLLMHPSEKVKTEIQNFIEQVQSIEPTQYYYPKSDLHITIMSIISCYDGFDVSQISIPNYVQTINKSIKDISSFNIEFRGLTASPSCIMVKGFLQDNSLLKLRDNLRTNFKSSNLQQSIDKRYSIITAHSTIIRFRNKFTNKKEFLQLIENYKNYHFGNFTVDTLELVNNDWYQRKENVRKLHEFRLR
jgi:2'-5' RNA ligase